MAARVIDMSRWKTRLFDCYYWYDSVVNEIADLRGLLVTVMITMIETIIRKGHFVTLQQGPLVVVI